MLTERQGERELLELFEDAKKAADAAEEDGVAEESRCLDALVQLKAFPVTIQLLVSTQVIIRSLINSSLFSLLHVFSLSSLLAFALKALLFRFYN